MGAGSALAPNVVKAFESEPMRIVLKTMIGIVASLGAAYAQETAPIPGPDLSPWGMFIGADPVVKVVLIGLVFASLVTWSVWGVKTLELSRVKKGLARDLEALADVPSLSDLASRTKNVGSLARAFIAAAKAELEASEPRDVDGIKERVGSRLDRLELQASRELGFGTGVLATIGATAPFVGLFGTVWGIMNAFVGITREQTTNLAVVAPGIAEALLATAIGLAAAIPAVVIYNHFVRRTAASRAMMGDLSALVLRAVSRELGARQAGVR